MGIGSMGIELVADWAGRIDDHLAGIRAAGRWRSIRSLSDGPAEATIVASGAPVVSFASNDYLGLSRHPAVLAAATEAIERWGAGSGSARLIVGSRPVHDQLEQALAAWKGTEAALTFPTGYQTNVGVIGALVRAGGGQRPLVVSDALNHASIIDGARLSRADIAVYRHADVAHLAEVCEANTGRPLIIVTDSIFSMDGDAADLAGTLEVAARHDAVVVLDEAHALWGPEPPDVLGAASSAAGVLVARVGTLSKTLGALGGFVAGSQDLIDLCRNVSRSFIFTTSASPADAAAALTAVGVVASPEGAALIERVRGFTDRLAPGHPSAIVPILLGEEEVALAVSERLAARGILVPAIRPPTVPVGSSRLRITFSAAHTDAQVDALLAALDEEGARP